MSSASGDDGWTEAVAQGEAEEAEAEGKEEEKEEEERRRRAEGAPADEPLQVVGS